MPDGKTIDADTLCETYLDNITSVLRKILVDERDALDAAATRLADQIAGGGLVHIYGPGGHSNLAAQEFFSRAGGLVPVSAILDEGTMLANGAFRSKSIERLPGYGAIVIEHSYLGPDNLLILVNAYGINAALIDAALEAKRRGTFVISISSHQHAKRTAPDHPARHPTRQNVHDLADIAIDTKMDLGDAVIEVPGVKEKVAPISTAVSAFALNNLLIRTVAKLAERGIDPPVWRSGNAPGGDEANLKYLALYRDRVRHF